MISNKRFLPSYVDAFYSIEGWFSPDAALLFMAYNQLIADQGITGNVLEIGVYNGLSSIGVAALRGQEKLFYAVDLFDSKISDRSSPYRLATKERFIKNLEDFHSDLSFLRIMNCHSQRLEPADLGNEFSFCHIDGGHSAEETGHDFALCSQILIPGGLLAVDDYFNPSFPGVCEGALDFRAQHPDALIPIAIGFNKVLFQKTPSRFSLNQKFASAFAHVNLSETSLWNQPVFHFDSGFRHFFDLQLSTPSSLVMPPGYIPFRASLEPAVTKLKLRPGERIQLQVAVRNESKVPMEYGNDLFGLSYHLLSLDGTMLRWDNERTHFLTTFEPGEERSVSLPVQAPNEQGFYQIELDIVCEGKMWLKACGNRTTFLHLAVE